MSTIQHVFKRGSVYWWRRRLRNGTTCRVLLRLELSLNTKDLHQAKRLAAELTLASERLALLLRDNMISAEDTKKILVKVAVAHSAKLDAVAANEIAYGADVESSRRADIATGWAYRLLSAHGKYARIGDHEVREMRSAGIDDATIVQAQQTIVSLKAGGAFPPREEKILDLIEEFGIQLTDGNYQQAQQLYLRGLAAALLDTRRRWSGIRFDDDALLQQALVDQAGSFGSAPTNTGPLESRVAAPELPLAQSSDAHPRLQVRAAAQEPQADRAENDLDVEEDEQEEVEEYRSLIEIVEEAAAYNLQAGDWRKDTRDQHVSLAKLFVRFVGHDNPGKMRQSHIAQFRSALIQFPKNYGKSPKDFTLTVPEILARAAEMPKEKVGLSVGTMNRHMTQMGNIAKICDAAGFPFADFGGVEKLRSRKKGSARAERPRFQTDELRTLCNLPIWTGCRSETERLVAGKIIIHDATYWVPLVGIFSGARREEICGLFLSEVEMFEGVPCLRLENSTIRDVKNEESKRRVPLHPELIRLGFLDYVEALRRAGHIYLFPELRAAAASTPMGDVFDDEWQKMRAAALPHAKEQGKVFHSIRHWCNNEMKQAKVTVEIRRDVIGHSNGADVNSGRYSDPASLTLMSEALATLPIPTAHLSAFPIRLSTVVMQHIPKPARKRKQA